MKKNLRIEPVISYKKLLAFLFDLLASSAAAVILFFLSIWAIGEPAFSYSNNKKTMKDMEQEYSLNIGSGKSYTLYEQALQSFYLVSFPEEIKNDVNKNYGTDYSIVHIYNVIVLQLPDVPTLDNYQTTFYEYRLNTDGTFNVDELALRREGMSGPNYEKNMRDLFYTSYSSLKSSLRDYSPTYKSAYTKTQTAELISRMICVSIPIIVFFIVIPMLNKYRSTLFERIYKIGHVKSKSGYIMPKYCVILNALIVFALPILGIYIFNAYSIILITVFWLFMNQLVMVFSSKNKTIAELILQIETADIENSLLFINNKDEKEYQNSDEFKQIDDPEYLNLLENANNIKTEK